jgi:hypothetical protein
MANPLRHAKRLRKGSTFCGFETEISPPVPVSGVCRSYPDSDDG